MPNLKYAEIAYLNYQLRAASRRLTNINLALTRDRHDPKLGAEAEGLTTQIAALELELKEMTA